MSPQRRPTLRSQWLGRQLRELREGCELKLSEVGEFIQRDGSQVSRFEKGTYPIRRADVLALLDFYSVRDEQRREWLCRCAEEAWRTDWWDGYAEEVRDWFVDYVWLESCATELQMFTVLKIPGLIQTPDYARAVIRAADLEASSGQVDRWVELRLKRQTIFGKETPPRVDMVVGEEALRRVCGGSHVHATQLRYLVESTGRTGCELRVLPFTAGPHASPDGEFSVFTLPEPHPEVAFVESPAGALYLEPPKTKRFAEMYDQLRKQAITPDDSIELIESIAKELE